MSELFGDSSLAEIVKSIFGEAASGQFLRTCSLFALAAFVHGRQVRKEIKDQFGLLVTVLRQDLEATKNTLGMLHDRVDKIEEHLNPTK